jgi:hypothetical protein
VSKQTDLYFGRFFAPEYCPKINMSVTCVRHDEIWQNAEVYLEEKK